jgi:glutathione S-transferase
LTIDANLPPEQKRLDLMLRRLLDDLYWVMSYSRWRDDNFWPAFRDAMLKTHADITPEALETAREYNFQRYYFQGIGRYASEDVYARGMADLGTLAELTPDQGFFFGGNATSTDAALYGFLANIHFFEIDTPLKRFIDARSSLLRHCELLHRLAA